MGAFILIGCPWLLVAIYLLWTQRRADNPTLGHWRSEPSNFFGGPASDEPAALSSSAKPSSAA